MTGPASLPSIDLPGPAVISWCLYRRPAASMNHAFLSIALGLFDSQTVDPEFEIGGANSSRVTWISDVHTQRSYMVDYGDL